MIKSMTGFGKGEAMVDDKKIRVELRSLNSKQLDLSIKLSEKYRAAEAELAAIIEATKVACAELNNFRVQEGAILIADLLGRIDLIEQYRHEVEQYETARLALVQSLRDEGKSYREIAEMTDMSAATVYRILQKVS